jgi:CelD/BcsL family acetyltransferase involved in cellulose biosynthesis
MTTAEQLESPARHSCGPAATTPLTFRLVSDEQELTALAPSWRHLLEQSASAEPMLSPDWLLTWWDVYSRNSDRSLRVGLLYQGEQLVALAPLCRRRYWYRPGIPFNRLEFLGSDTDEQDGVCSVYLDFVARAGLEQPAAEAFAREIVRGGFDRWDEVVLGALNGAAGAPERLLEAFRLAGCPGEQQTTTESPYLRLPANWDEYLKSLNKKKRKYFVQAMRSFESWAGTDWKVEHARTPEEYTRGRQILLNLHGQRWEKDDSTGGAFARPRFCAFHDAYMARLFQQGNLDLCWLSVRGVPIMVNYHIVTNGKVYFYQCGRSLDVPEAQRPGIVLLSFALQKAMADGLREYDFLPAPLAYKLKFTQTTRPLVQVRVVHDGPREWLRRSIEFGITGARKLRDAYRRRRAPVISPESAD